MSKRYDVVATLRFTKRDGTEGKSYARCGTAFEGPKGISIKLDSVPVSKDWDGWLSLYEPKEKAAEPANAAPARRADRDDEPIPF